MREPITDSRVRAAIEATTFKTSKATGLILPEGVREPDTFFKVQNFRKYSKKLKIWVDLRYFLEFEDELTKNQQLHHLFTYALLATRQWVKQQERQKLEGENVVGTNYHLMFKTYAHMIDIEPWTFANGWARVDKLWRRLFTLDATTSYPIPDEVLRADKFILSTGEKFDGQRDLRN